MRSFLLSRGVISFYFTHWKKIKFTHDRVAEGKKRAGLFIKVNYECRLFVDCSSNTSYNNCNTNLSGIIRSAEGGSVIIFYLNDINIFIHESGAISYWKCNACIYVWPFWNNCLSNVCNCTAHISPDAIETWETKHPWCKYGKISNHLYIHIPLAYYAAHNNLHSGLVKYHCAISGFNPVINYWG